MARSGGDALKIQENRRIISFLERERNLEKSLNRNDSSSLPAAAAVKEEKFGGSDTSWIFKVPSCPVFSPSIEEFQDPLAYISSIAPEASKYGMCKIISPLSPCVPAGKVLMKENGCFKFNTRVQALRLSNWDSNDKVTFFTSAQRYTFQEFEKVANKFFSRKFSSAALLPPAFVEAEFWRELLSERSESIEYASDVDGSAFSADPNDPLATSKWNLKDVSCLPSSTLRLLDAIIPGVTEPMLYIGMLFSMFAWHVEDHYLYSINYHHCGAPKTWYGVPGGACEMFETFVKDKIYDSGMLAEHGRGAAYDLLIGKTTMFPPGLLLKNDVPVYKAVQSAGEFVITFPRSYHAGFSHGFNCGEAVNFAMADWFPFGAAACRRYSLLNRMPLLPHEELVWKEAALISKSSGTCGFREQAIKAAFVRLMGFQHKVRWLSKQRGASLCISSDVSENVFCMLCKHMCYISLVTCPCFPEPICLNHAEEMRKCQCGNKRCLLLHKDVKEMDAVARSFRSSVENIAVVQDGMRTEQTFPVLEEDLLDSEDYSSYVSFAKMGDEYKAVKFSDIVIKVEKDTKAAEVVEAPSKVAVQKAKPGVAIRKMPEKKTLVVKKAVIRDEALRSCFKRKEFESQGSSGKDRFRSRRVKVCQTTYGESALLVKDIVAELKRPDPVHEVMKTWQADARKQGFILDYAYVDEQRALPYKACQLLTKLLPESEALKLEKLLKWNFPDASTSRPSSVDLEESRPGKRGSVDRNDKSSTKRLKAGSRSPKDRSTSSNFGFGMDSNNNRSVDLENQGYTDAHSKRVLVKNGERVNTKQQDIPRLKIKGPSLPGKMVPEGNSKSQDKAYVSTSRTVTVGGR